MYYNITIKAPNERRFKMAVKTVAQGISGTIKWTLDEEGTLFFEPVNGEEGTFADTQNYSREWEPYNKSIKQIKSNGKINLANDSNYMFYHCSSLSNIDALKNWNTQNVTSMSAMFFHCSSLTSTDALKNWNTQNVTSMSAMFQGCSSLTDTDALKNWNTQNVISTCNMFQGCSSLSDSLIPQANIFQKKIKNFLFFHNICCLYVL